MSIPPDGPVTYLITEGSLTADNFGSESTGLLERVRLAVEHGISMVQIREKSLPTRLLCDLAASAVGITDQTKTKLLINDRADVALAIGADGVHLTSNSLSAGAIRNTFGSAMIIGVSVHSLDEAIRAADDGADFAVFAPVFATPGKATPQGIDILAQVCREVEPFPILALGGVDETNIVDVLDAGARGIAAIRSLNDEKTLRSISDMFARYAQGKNTDD